jgi:hypothetical protein
VTAPSKDARLRILKGRLNEGSLGLCEQADLQAELRRLRTKSTVGRSPVVNPNRRSPGPGLRQAGWRSARSAISAGLKATGGSLSPEPPWEIHANAR